MDPACGSGTFLFHAVRALLDEAQASGLPPAEAVHRATKKIAGIDIHPVAVIFARVTYLLALVPTLLKGHPGSVALPVYLGDALQWNLVRSGGSGGQMTMFANSGTLEIFVPAVKVSEPQPRLLDAATLRFPATVASDAGLFDRVLSTMIESGARSRPAADFAAWMEREVSASTSDQEVLRETYEVMCRLQNEDRNHIWGYIARNLARPVWLSSEGQKADVVIGNPPWVAYRFMGGGFQERFRRECRSARLWVGGNVATQQDLSSYFYIRAALLYMRSSGRIALVMPYAALSRRAYLKFRTGKVAQSGFLEFRLCFTEAWAFGHEVWPLFPVPSCVLFANRHNGVSPASLPMEVQAFEGFLPKRDANEGEAAASLAGTPAPWPAEVSGEGGSPYRDMFRNGATLWPRRLVLVEPLPTTGLLPANPAFPRIQGRTSGTGQEAMEDCGSAKGYGRERVSAASTPRRIRCPFPDAGIPTGHRSLGWRALRVDGCRYRGGTGLPKVGGMARKVRGAVGDAQGQRYELSRAV